MLSVITPAQVGGFQYGLAYPDFVQQQQKWQAFKEQSSAWSYQQYPALQCGRSQNSTRLMQQQQQSSSFHQSSLQQQQQQRSLQQQQQRSLQQQQLQQQPSSRGLVLPSSTAKDYSKPLFVDCSIEYELPNAPKIPKNSEPILMIHPSFPKKKISTPPSVQARCSVPTCRCNVRKRLQDKVQRRVQPTQAVKRTYDCVHEERKANYKHFLLNSNQGLFAAPQFYDASTLRRAPSEAMRRAPSEAPPPAKRSRMQTMMSYPAIQQSLSYPLQTWGYPTQPVTPVTPVRHAVTQVTPPDTYETYWNSRAMYAAPYAPQYHYYYPRGGKQVPPPQSNPMCVGCVQGKCPRNKENFGLMRSL